MIGNGLARRLRDHQGTVGKLPNDVIRFEAVVTLVVSNDGGTSVFTDRDVVVRQVIEVFPGDSLCPLPVGGPALGAQIVANEAPRDVKLLTLPSSNFR